MTGETVRMRGGQPVLDLRVIHADIVSISFSSGGG